MASANCDECVCPTRENNSILWKHKSILADFLCYDCEKYVCSNCITKHTDHQTFSVKEKSNKTELDKMCQKMTEQLTSEGHQILVNFKRKRSRIWDVIELEGSKSITNICILYESKKWVITDHCSKRIIVFNINNNKLVGLINLQYGPYGVAEIPSIDPSQCLIAISYPYQKQIDIMNIYSEPAQVISSVKVNGESRDLAYCNNKLITRCTDYMVKEDRHSIHVVGMSGEIINIIDLNKLPGYKLMWSDSIRMTALSESETIYICHYDESPSVISLSMDGHVLHSVMFTDIKPHCICIDRNHVYVMGSNCPLYKLSSDLSQKEKIWEKWPAHPHHFQSIACHADTFYFIRTDELVFIVRLE